MAASTGITAQPLTPDQAFNWILLIELLVCGVGVLFFLFYFNRLFATLVSFALRAYTWHKFRVYIDVQGLQLSLLGGRLFFKGVRYHGENETIFVSHGHITWRYWLRNVRQSEYQRFRPPSARYGSDGKSENDESLGGSPDTTVETGGVAKEDQRPCRIGLKLSGLEWFIYNRTPAYENILDATKVAQTKKGEKESYTSGTDLSQGNETNDSARRPTKLTKIPPRSKTGEHDGQRIASYTSDESISLSNPEPNINELQKTATSASQDPAEPPSLQSLGFLSIFPVQLECNKGALILGNEHTKTLLTNTFDRVEGRVDVGPAGPLDLYRQIFDFEITHPVVQMRPNPDFRQSQSQAAEELVDRDLKDDSSDRHWASKWKLQNRSRHMLRSIKHLVPYFQHSVESLHSFSKPRYGHVPSGNTTFDGERRWLGLARYLDESVQDDHEAWNHVDYARFSTVLDCPSLSLTFFWDVPGPVRLANPDIPVSAKAASQEVTWIVNGAEQPAYGMNVIVRGGSINYGPWSDRARAEIQGIFFPNAYQDAIPAKPLKVGENRLSTTFTMNVEIEKEISIRLPVRENSKDWQWRGRADAVRDAAKLKRSKTKRYGRSKKGDKSVIGPNIRPFGWIAMSIEANSTISFAMDMYANEKEYASKVNVELAGTRMTSSVNHGLLWRCGPQRVICDLPNPIGWNALREWTFTIHSHLLEFFILRDHMFLLIDLVNDWSMGPPPDYLTFVPFKYYLNLEFSDLKLYLNTNDANIIDDPADPADNSFVILGGRTLLSKLEIPIDKYRPLQNRISFDANFKDASLDFSTPVWNTDHTFVEDGPLATLKQLDLDGSYNYFLSTSPSLTDSLIMNIRGMTPKLYLHGFLIRHFMKIKDNYFGEDLHFRTLAEFQERALGDKPTTGPDANFQKKDNDLDVILTVQADDGTVILPGNLYSRKENIQLDILTMEADLRFTNYYMDMDARFSPIEASTEVVSLSESGRKSSNSRTQLFLDGLEIYGHRLFGLPPTEPTYVCNWDFHVGKLLGECSTAFLNTFITSIRSLVFTLDDYENALPVIEEVLNDVTLLRAYIDSIRIWFLVGDSAILLSAGPTEVRLSDLADDLFSERIKIKVPDIILASVDASSAGLRREAPTLKLPTNGAIHTSLNMRVLERTPEFSKNRELQKEHVIAHDERTQRVPWLTNTDGRSPNLRRRSVPPAMPLPSMPSPIKSHPHRSFLSQQDLQKGRQQEQDNKKRPNNFFPDRADAHQGGIGQSQAPAAEGRVTISSSTVTYASPWCAPHFTLAHCEPDLQELPTLSTNTNSSSASFSVPENFAQGGDEDKAGHNSIVVNLGPGLVCFLAPATIAVVSKLLRDLSPTHPEDILDVLQMDCISKIVDTAKLEAQPPKLLDFKLLLPWAEIRAINSYNVHQEGIQSENQDIYTINAKELNCISRIATRRTGYPHKPSLAQRLWLQSSCDELSLIVSGKASFTQREQAALQAFIRDTAVWAGTGDTLTSNIQFRSIDVSTWTKSIDFISALVDRSMAVAEGCVVDLKESLADERRRLKRLVYSLSNRAHDLPDPAFLTRPSYVLRTATAHLRTNDSWKIISRLRHIYLSQSALERDAIFQECQNASLLSQEDSKAHVITAFDQWRTWDLGQVDGTTVMNLVWDPAAVKSTLPAQGVCIGLTVGNTHVVLDPGAKQSEIALGDLGVLASMLSGENQLETQNIQRRLSVRTYSSKTAIRLNWEVYELVDETIKLLQSRHQASTPVSNPQVRTEDLKNSNLAIHVVFGTDDGSLTLDSVNLKVSMMARLFKGSITHQESKNSIEVPGSSMLVSAFSTTSEISSHGQSLMDWRLRAPNVYVHFSPADVKYPSGNLKVAANCQKISYQVTSDLPSLAEIVEKFVEDEVSTTLALLEKLQKQQVPRPEQPKILKPRVRFSVALFLNNYEISVKLLPTLTYVIAGDVARSALAPYGKDGLRVDFDLQRTVHSLHSEKTQGGDAFSSIILPPVNGRVTISQRQAASVVVADISIDRIKLEGGALRAIVDALGKPETQSALEGSKSSIRRTTRRLETILGDHQPPSDKGQPLPELARNVTLYTARCTLGGLSVHTSAPARREGATSTTELDFALSLIRLKVHNGQENGTQAFSRPQFQIDLRQTSLDLRETHNGRTKSHGSLRLGMVASGKSEIHPKTGQELHSYRLASGGFNIDLFPKTATLITDIAMHLQERIKDLDLSHDYKPVRRFRRLTRPELFDHNERQRSDEEQSEDSATAILEDSTINIELALIQVNWIVREDTPLSPGRQAEDLVFSVRNIDLSTKQGKTARLAISDLQLQMVPKGFDKRQRTLNSALLPEVVFNVAYFGSRRDWRLAFQAAGKALDLRLTSDFILPASSLQRSLASASHILRTAEVFTSSSMTDLDAPKPHMFGKKRLSSLLVDADFAGAVVTMQERPEDEPKSAFSVIKGNRRTRTGRYEQFVQGDISNKAILRAPGIALKVEFQDRGDDDPSLSGQIKVAASKNVLNPTVVPLVLEISSSVKEVVGEKDTIQYSKMASSKSLTETSVANSNPSAILGNTRLDLGLWVQEQEFSLTCQPIARVAATARFDDIFMTVNTVQAAEQPRFFSLLMSFNSLSASVQHVYSRESTASFNVESITMSLMNSKHVSSTSGISAIVNVSPMKTFINAKQVQDFLLFREIWYPPELRAAPTAPVATPHPDSQAFVVQRYQQVAATEAFPLNALISISALEIEIDLGQSIGKATFSISKLWTSTKKSSDLEQNLCLGFEKISIKSTGRTSGFIELRDFRLRTSITLPSEQDANRTPLIQASADFEGFRVNTAFDYQPFLVADITSFHFLMFNVREEGTTSGDRLVGILEGDKVQVYCLTGSAALGLAFYQALMRLVQEKQSAYEASLKELDRFLTRRSAGPTGSGWADAALNITNSPQSKKPKKPAFSLHTHVVVSLKAVNVGAFPNSFFDSQIFKMEASNAEARFSVDARRGRTHSNLSMTLGQLRVALSSVNRSNTQAFGEVIVEDVVKSGTGSRGGTILKVPKVVARMETWQTTPINRIDYIFKSSFEGKVDVGWNYSRISFIRGMWSTHSRALASRLGKPLPQSAVQITGGIPKPSSDSGPATSSSSPTTTITNNNSAGGIQPTQEKITAVVNIPQEDSRFEYFPLEPPVIETPQLRDMGEATPPLEWIGLHREKLPNMTHQIIIISLLEVAKEVEEAYDRILGGS